MKLCGNVRLMLEEFSQICDIPSVVKVWECDKSAIVINRIEFRKV